MSISLLERIRARVVKGDWRNYLAWDDNPLVDVWHDKIPGCILQLCSQEEEGNAEDRVSLYDALDPNYTGSMITWNDEPSRTSEEVIALIDKAIELERTRS